MNTGNVLIAEKESIVALSTKKLFESFGYTIPAIANSLEDIEKNILEFNPEFIVMETVLECVEKRDGIIIAEELKEKYQIPVLFYTSYADPITMENARKVEPIGYYSKTMQDHQLKYSLELTLKYFNSHIAEKKEKARLEHITAISPNFLVNVDGNGVIHYANQQSFRFTGKQHSDLVGEYICDIFGDADTCAFFLEIIAKTKEKKRKTFTEGEITTFMGGRHIEVSAVPQMNELKEIVSFSFIINDVTDQKLITMDMQDKHKKITDSINYSRNIQQAIFSDLNNVFDDYFDGFIINKPKDVIGGDFAWWHKEGDNIYFAVADCTGHGVPGAMMSLIGYFLLNQVAQHMEYNPSQILTLLDKQVKATLRQEEEESANSRDGMDISLCKINLREEKLEYSGAHRPLYFVRNGELQQIKGSRKGIGGMTLRKKKETYFENTEVLLQEGDTFYMFSDGMPDQMNKANDKFSPRKIREIVVENSDKDMGEIQEVIMNAFNEFKGPSKQLDDVMFAGIRV